MPRFITTAILACAAAAPWLASAPALADWDKAMGWFTGPEYAAVTSKRDEVSDFRMAVVAAM